MSIELGVLEFYLSITWFEEDSFDPPVQRGIFSYSQEK